MVMCGFGVHICVFFFKQKTAYEVRISDWSSDVCSSDLQGRSRSSRSRSSQARARAMIGAAMHVSALSVEAHGRRTELVLPPRGADDRLVGAVRRQIGRASCRERVCKYV